MAVPKIELEKPPPGQRGSGSAGAGIADHSCRGGGAHVAACGPVYLQRTVAVPPAASSIVSVRPCRVVRH